MYDSDQAVAIGGADNRSCSGFTRNKNRARHESPDLRDEGGDGDLAMEEPPLSLSIEDMRTR
jgi:hypothetical protein